jgi:hypothetical protein
MNTPATELVFPPKLVSSLRDLRDADWMQLVDRISTLEPTHVDRMAFELMIVRWSGCINCQADSFRAMQGCTQCAAQAVRRYRGNTSDLLHLFAETVREVEEFLVKLG